MDVNVRYLGGKMFEMTARGHRVLADQPFDNKGTDAAMTPPEMFLSSLGACAAYYAAEYLNARNLPAAALQVRVSADKGDRPVRITYLEVEVIAPGLDERHREGLRRAVDLCLIKNTLVKAPDIKLDIVSSAGLPQPEPVLS